MSARIATQPIGSTSTDLSDYRPRSAPKLPQVADPAEPTGTDIRKTTVAVETGAPAPQPLPEPDAPGTAYVMAVISGALSPRPSSMQEVYLRTGTGWVPPDSEYRLTDRKI